MIYLTGNQPIAYFAELLQLGDAVVVKLRQKSRTKGPDLRFALVTWGKNLPPSYIEKVDTTKRDFVSFNGGHSYESVIKWSLK